MTKRRASVYLPHSGKSEVGADSRLGNAIQRLDARHVDVLDADASSLTDLVDLLAELNGTWAASFVWVVRGRHEDDVRD
jgi:hypothetical protein